MVTITYVAKYADGSPATDSRVVNGLVGYSAQARERVEDLSYETDYLVAASKPGKRP